LNVAHARTIFDGVIPSAAVQTERLVKAQAFGMTPPKEAAPQFKPSHYRKR